VQEDQKRAVQLEKEKWIGEVEVKDRSKSLCKKTEEDRVK